MHYLDDRKSNGSLPPSALVLSQIFTAYITTTAYEALAKQPPKDAVTMYPRAEMLESVLLAGMARGIALRESNRGQDRVRILRPSGCSQEPALQR
ncbi:MAG: hypothetical protein ABI748_12280 [Dokdonella sp.]